ncbi:MAG: hypothetical protein ABWY11_18895, partial [Umezawaea sp.]
MTDNGDTHNDVSGSARDVIQARTINNNFYGHAPAPAAQDVDEWVRLVRDSKVWSHVAKVDSGLQDLAVDVAHSLVRMRDVA